MSIIIRDGTNSALTATVDTNNNLHVMQGGLPSDVITTGQTITANGVSASTSAQGAAEVMFNITGTWVGTLTPQAQLADGSWVNALVFPTLPSGTSVATISANGQWKIVVGGMQGFRILSTAWTSGTATINFEAAQNQSVIQALVKGNTGAALDAITGTTAPAAALQAGLVAATAFPTGVTNGQLVGAMGDKAGRTVIVSNAPRDLIGTASVQSTSAVLATLVAAGAAGVFNDLISLTLSNEGTATVVSLSDGTTTYKFALGAGAVLAVVFPSTLPATSSATVWQVSNSAAQNVDCVVTYAKNK
jgi:hypothetical protein